nr:nucleic acid-binding, OB-fold protein [Tanacetum cinerariifolium]
IKIQIRVQDESGSTSFYLFQQEIAKLLGKSVAYLISKIDKVSDTDSVEKALAKGGTKTKNTESQQSNPKVEHQDAKADIVYQKTTRKEACETSAVGRSKRKIVETEEFDMEKKAKVDHKVTKDETI